MAEPSPPSWLGQDRAAPSPGRGSLFLASHIHERPFDKIKLPFTLQSVFSGVRSTDTWVLVNPVTQKQTGRQTRGSHRGNASALTWPAQGTSWPRTLGGPRTGVQREPWTEGTQRGRCACKAQTCRDRDADATGRFICRDHEHFPGEPPRVTGKRQSPRERVGACSRTCG